MDIKCHKSQNCSNYSEKCSECWTMADLYNNYPMFVQKAQEKYTKFKTFFSFIGIDPADERVNRWLAENSNIRILDFKFSAYPNGHAICVMYEEESDA